MTPGFGDPKQQLNVDQMTEIGQTARHTGYLELAVSWLRAALERANLEPKVRARLRGLLDTAKEEHDGHLLTNGFMVFDKASKLTYSTHDTPYDPELTDSEVFRKHKKDFDWLESYCSRDTDLALLPIGKEIFWRCIYMGLENRRRQLCQGNHYSSTSSPGLRCSLLHQQDPYIQLAPFKFEQVKVEPFMGMLVDIVYPEEMALVREEARGKMIATTLVDYNAPDDVKDDYTSRRTSKVTYRSERALPRPLKSWTKRIELATKLGKNHKNVSG